MQNKRPKKTKYSKYHKGRISYNLPILKDIDNKQSSAFILPTPRTDSFKEKGRDIIKDIDNKLTYQLIALEPCRLTASHLTAIELAIKRKLSTMPNITIMNKDTVENEIILVRKNVFPKLIFNAFPHIPVTKKPAEVRMGKGKGSIDYWMTRIRIGTPIVELSYIIPYSKSLDSLDISKKKAQAELVINKKIVTNLSNLVVKSAFNLASSKLPIKTKLVFY